MFWKVYIIAACIQLACGTTYQFKQTSGNNLWSIAANWEPTGIPTNDDDVIIPYTPAGSYTVTLNVQGLCRSLTVGGPTSAGSWDPSNTQILVVSGTLAMNGNCTVLLSGILQVAGALIQGTAPQATVLVKGGLVFGNSGTHSVQNLLIMIENQGYMSIAQEPNGVILADWSNITIQAGGNMTMATGYGINNANDQTAVALINYGDIYCQPADTDNYATQVNVPFQNYGNLHVVVGTLSLGSNSTWTSGTLNVASQTTFSITGGTHRFLSQSAIQGQGTFQIQSATVTLEGSVMVSEFILGSGSTLIVAAQNTLEFSSFQILDSATLAGLAASIQQLTWAGGIISMGSLSVGQLLIVPTQNNQFTGTMRNTPFSVTSQATFQNSTHLLLYNSTFTLEEGAQMTFATDIFIICDKNDSSSALQVGGTLQVTYAQQPITLTCPLLILPGGVLTTTQGLLDIQTPVSSSGTLNILPGSAVTLETTGTFFVGSSVTGGGTLNCQSCTAQFLGTFNVGTINFPAGSMTFETDYGTVDYIASVQFYNQSGSSALFLINNSPSTLNFTVANMKFAGGNMTSNHNAQISLASNLIITNSASFTGTSPYLFTSIAFINYGTTTFYASGDLLLFQSSLIHNMPTGTIQVTAGSLTAAQDDPGSGYLSTIRNEGSLLVNVGATATLGMNILNLGYLEINGSFLIPSGFFTQQGNSISYIPAGGALELANPGLFLGGTLKGSGLIKGSEVTLSGATLNVDGTSSPVISALIIRGNSTLSVDIGSGAKLQVQGMCQISGGNLALYSSVPVSTSTIQYASAPGISGSGFDNIVQSSLNTSYGFSISNNTGGLYAVVVPMPTITSVTPASGASGTIVTLAGNNFYVGTTAYALNVSVLFQGSAVPVNTVLTVDSITAVVPIGTGTVSVAVLADGRLSNAMTWQYAAPTITAIQSALPCGPSAGGNTITIAGQAFGQDPQAVQVMFGAPPPSSSSCAISLIADDQIVCSVPAGVGGNVSVIVQVSQQASAPAHYTYCAPTLLSVYPSALEASSVTGPITINGQNLAASTTQSNVTIQIGTSICGSLTQASLTTFTCVPPTQITAESASYPIKVIVAGQSSTNLTFRVFSISEQKATSWWPLPWWILVAVGGALVVCVALGVVLGCYAGARRASGRTPGGYEPISSDAHQEKRRSAIIN